MLSKGVIDRFEGQFAIVECESHLLEVPKSLLPDGAKEGSSLTLEIKLDLAEEDKRRTRIESKLNALLNQNKVE